MIIDWSSEKKTDLIKEKLLDVLISRSSEDCKQSWNFMMCTPHAVHIEYCDHAPVKESPTCRHGIKSMKSFIVFLKCSYHNDFLRASFISVVVSKIIRPAPVKLLMQL